MTFFIRPAGTEDVDTLMALRTEAEEWLRGLGTDQWSDPETGPQAIAKWRQAIDDGRTWVVLDEDATTVGTVSRGSVDRDFWTDDDQPETAFYLYKLIVGRSTAGLNVGSLVLDWACRIASLEGRQWVRIDCWRSNLKLQRYYENLGFAHVRTEAPPHRKSGWLAQRPTSLICNGTQLRTRTDGLPRARDHSPEPNRPREASPLGFDPA